MDPFFSLISKFLVYVILVALLMNLCFGAEVPVAISNAYRGQAGVLAPLTGPKPYIGQGQKELSVGEFRAIQLVLYLSFGPIGSSCTRTEVMW